MRKEHAFDFMLFALRNPKACPILDVTEAGTWEPKLAAPGADLRSDMPKYNIYRDGALAEEVPDVTALWAEDMVGFLLGCSFSWEDVLSEAGLMPRQVEEKKNVPMFRTNLPNVAAGVFQGDLVVSMRPYKPEDAEKVAAITAQYPAAHGGPIHQGSPEEIGVSSEQVFSTEGAGPDWGDGVEIREGEVPVFWACGVTPQTAIMDAKLPLVITHSPGHMFICDLRNEEVKVDAEPPPNKPRT